MFIHKFIILVTELNKTIKINIKVEINTNSSLLPISKLIIFLKILLFISDSESLKDLRNKDTEKRVKYSKIPLKIFINNIKKI